MQNSVQRKYSGPNISIPSIIKPPHFLYKQICLVVQIFCFGLCECTNERGVNSLIGIDVTIGLTCIVEFKYFLTPFKRCFVSELSIRFNDSINEKDKQQNQRVSTVL